MRSRLTLEMLLNERVINALDPEERVGWIDQLVPIVLSSYDYVGGYKGANDPDTLRAVLHREAQKPGYWKMVVKDGKALAVRFYRQSDHGLKGNMTAAEKSPEGKAAMAELSKGDVRSRVVWGELSGRALKYFQRQGWQDSQGASEQVRSWWH